MENIEIFDRYIKSEMSSDEVKEFREKLSEDKCFADEFNIYLTVVDALRKEEEQDNFDFAIAMKKLSSEKLSQIIGKKDRPKPHIRIASKSILWPLSMAAVILLAFTITFNIGRNANERADDLIVEYNAVPLINRGGDTSKDILSMDDDQVEKYLPDLRKQYENTAKDDIQDKQNSGIALAMAYLKIHDRKKAVETLIDLRNIYVDDIDFVSYCEKLINQIGS